MFFRKKVLKKFNSCPYCQSIDIEKKLHYKECKDISDYTQNALLGAGKGATKAGLSGMGAPIGAVVGMAAGLFKTLISTDFKEIDEYHCKKCGKYFEIPKEIEMYVRE